MDNGYKTSVVVPEQEVAAVTTDASEDTLATQALEDIRDAERHSGVGRFATKVQGFFRASSPSSTQPRSSHLKAAPILMSAGLLLLLATGLLFLLSKPESAVHSHFRPPTGLSGTADRKPVAGPSTEPLVTENQLVGGDTNGDRQGADGSKAGARGREDTTGHRFAFADEGGTSNNSISPNPTANSELQNPATVFVASPVSGPMPNLPSTLRDLHESEIQIPAGTEIIAHTTNAISSGLESPVIAVVDRNVQLGDAVVIPQGTRVIGSTAGVVKDRINVRFTSLLLPNSREVAISGLALMKDGSAGLTGKVQGSGRPVLATAARIGTGAAVVATEFAGVGGLNQPFSQSDYLRNQMASEIASQGNRYSSRLQQTTNVPIVTVKTNQPVRIFLLNALSVADGHARNGIRPQATDTTTSLAEEQGPPPDQSLTAAQTAYIQALEAQLADLRAALDRRKPNGRD